MKRALCLLTLIVVTLAVVAQHSQDFVSKFMSMHQKDTTIECITVSPKMMEQLVQQQNEGHSENIVQAIAKLKSMRIVNAMADYYKEAEDLLHKYAQRFEQRHDYQGDTLRGAIYTRKNKKGENVEMIMIHENTKTQRLTIIDLTGDIDEEFLCFLYNINH